MYIYPKDAIKMEEDSEGFKYPRVNKDKCIDCGLCKKVCPILNNKNEIKHEQNGYVINKDNKIRKASIAFATKDALLESINNGMNNVLKKYQEEIEIDFLTSRLSIKNIFC